MLISHHCHAHSCWAVSYCKSQSIADGDQGAMSNSMLFIFANFNKVSSTTSRDSHRRIDIMEFRLNCHSISLMWKVFGISSAVCSGPIIFSPWRVSLKPFSMVVHPWCQAPPCKMRRVTQAVPWDQPGPRHHRKPSLQREGPDGARLPLWVPPSLAGRTPRKPAGFEGILTSILWWFLHMIWFKFMFYQSLLSNNNLFIH